jgi:hypothetical protein
VRTDTSQRSEVDLVVERASRCYVLEKIEAGADVADETAAGSSL